MRLHPVPPRRLIKFLERKGFSPVSQKGSHLKLKDGGGRVVIVPLHATLRVGLLRAILRDAGVSPSEFLDRL